MAPRITAVLIAALTAGACTASEDTAEPIVARWQSTLLVAGQYNQLDIDADMGGDAKLYFYVDNEPYYADFDATATRTRDGVYAVRLDCVGDCSAYDFVMDCYVGDGGDEMSCDAGGLWADYAFDWRLQ